jgi:hypothetical protein
MGGVVVTRLTKHNLHIIPQLLENIEGFVVDAILEEVMAEATHKVRVGRCSGPCTDKEGEALFTDSEVEVVKDVLKMVNLASNNKEKWYLVVDDGDIVVPV